MARRRSSFWTSLPGLLTAAGTLVAACAGLLALLLGRGAAARTAASVVSASPSPEASASPSPKPSASSGVNGSWAPLPSSPALPSAGRSRAPPPASRPLRTAPTSSPQSFQAEVDVIRADPYTGTVTCPVTVTFTARISVTQGGGLVSYRWMRSDGASAPVQTLTFGQPGSQDITETWSLGAPGETLSQWEAVQLLSPASVASQQAAFNLTCAS